MTAPDRPGTPFWRPDQLLGAKHDTPDQTGALVDFEPITPGPDRPGAPDGRTYSAPETAGQAAYEAFAKAIPEDVFPEHLRDMGWTDWADLRDHERPAWEAAAQAAIAAAAPAPAGEGGCRTCDGSGMLEVPDAGGESASMQACPDPAHDGDDWFEVGDADAGTLDVTSAQATYGRYRQAMYERGVIVCDWDGLTDEDRESWAAALTEALDLARAEAAAIRAAAANTARELAEVTEQRDGLRYGIERAISHLEESAAATSPSKKSAIEVAVAGRLRALLDGAGQPGTES